MFDLPVERARNELLPDRAEARLLVSTGNGEHYASWMKQLPYFLPDNALLVLNTSGTFMARVRDAVLPDGTQATVHFATPLEDTMLHWVVVVPTSVVEPAVIQLPGGASLELRHPHLVRGSVTSWRDWGRLWVARFQGDLCFEHWNPQYGSAVQYAYDTVSWQPDDLQNSFSARRTSARMNNGGRNLTAGLLEQIMTRGIQIAQLELRTALGNDQDGYPFPEFVRLDAVNAARINLAIASGDLVLPVGTGVIRALDWLYDSDSSTVRAEEGWCDNLITPERGTWLHAWLSGMHEPKSTHLAMGSAIMGEVCMRTAMEIAYKAGFYFHENGDTHLYLPKLG
jgi:S-adenosylmethionine:tRNA ribosyltransferase-isomerase